MSCLISSCFLPLKSKVEITSDWQLLRIWTNLCCPY
jgi:hypothetical protein